MSNDKHRPPDHFVQIVTKNASGRDKHRDIGELWEGKNGYMSGDSALGRIVVQSREQREKLQQMRAEKAQTQDQGQSQEPSDEPKL